MTDVQHLTEASVRIEAAAQHGSGFFVAPDLVVTCAHVAGAVGDAVKLHTFDGTVLPAEVREIDEAADVAVMRVLAPCAYPALPLDDAGDHQRGHNWVAYGFPRIARSAPVLIEGQVRMIASHDAKGRAALQLYSADAAAGKGAYLDGFSGSAVVMCGRVVGQTRTTPKDLDGTAQLGLVFATPSAAIAAILARTRPHVIHRARRDPQPPHAPYDPTWYVHRPVEEARAAADLDAQKAVVLTGPQYFGKSLLLRHIVESARNREKQRGRDARIVEIDLGGLGVEPEMDLGPFFLLFAEALVREYGLAPEAYVGRYLSPAASGADAVRSITPPAARALLHELLSLTDKPLYLVLSQAEALIRWPPLDLFAQWLRSAATSRGVFRSLRLLVEFSTAPALVTQQMPSFNIAPEQIVVKDFTSDQAGELAALYDLAWGSAEVGRLFGLVGGHPYLLRRAMFEAALARTPVERIIEEAQGDGGVFREFLHRNLDPIYRTKALRDAACSIAYDRQPPPEQPEAIDQLLAAGIVRRGRTIRDISVACPLYRYHLQAMGAMGTP